MNPGALSESPSPTFFFMNLSQELSNSLEADKRKHAELTIELNNLCRNIHTRSDTARIQSLQDKHDLLTGIIQRTEQAIAFNNAPLNRSIQPASTFFSPSLNIPTNLPRLAASSHDNHEFDIIAFIGALENVLEGHRIPKEDWSTIVLTTVPQNDQVTGEFVRNHIQGIPWDEARLILQEHFDSTEVIRRFNDEFLSLKIAPNEMFNYFCESTHGRQARSSGQEFRHGTRCISQRNSL